MGFVLIILYVFIGSLVGRAVYLKRKSPTRREFWETDPAIIGWAAGTLWPFFLIVLPGLLLADRFFNGE